MSLNHLLPNIKFTERTTIFHHPISCHFTSSIHPHSGLITKRAWLYAHVVVKWIHGCAVKASTVADHVHIQREIEDLKKEKGKNISVGKRGLHVFESSPYGHPRKGTCLRHQKARM